MKQAGVWYRTAGAACLAVWLLLPPGTSFSQTLPAREVETPSAVKISDHETQPALKQLVNVREFLSAQQWDEAVETLREVMERYADQMVRLPDGRYINVRNYCHLQLAEWQTSAPAALKLYRERVDPLAQRWYEEGLAKRDAAQLYRVADQFLCSSWGDDALLALGELELRAGRCSAAREYWERISPALKSASGKPLWLELRGKDLNADWPTLEPLVLQRPQPLAWVACCETNLDLAAVRARLILTSILEGSLERAAVELALLKKLSPESVGPWGGKEGNYVARLTEMLEAAPHWPAVRTTPDWLTFAGDERRDKLSAKPVRIVGSAWKEPVTLEGPLQPETPLARSRVGEGADGLLSYHPLVVGNLLLINGPRGIRALDLKTGLAAWHTAQVAEADDTTAAGRFFAEEHPNQGLSRAGNATVGVARYTMTARDGRLLVRLGDPVTSWTSDGFRENHFNSLACFDLEASGTLLWKALPEGDAADPNTEARWAFEGAPLSDGPNVYIALRRSERPPQAYVACLNAQTGKQKWRRLICEAERNLPGEVSEITHNLLTLADGMLYYNTNLGAVAAVRADDGRVQWVSTYQRALAGEPGEQAAYQDRDLNPCLAYRGMILVAPRGSRSVLALDAATGVTLWSTDLPRDVVHLLGVRDNTLIASGRRLWWIDVLTGKPRYWPEGELTGLQAYGRGAIAGQEIYWPVRNHSEAADQILVFDTGQPRQVREPITLSHYGATAGNLLVSDGYLLIAGAQHLFAFGQNPPAAEPPEKEITELIRNLLHLAKE